MSTPPTNDVGFVQQGQVDWVAFAKAAPPFAIEVLGRIQAAGVHAMTFAAILQLTACFKLSARGRDRLWDAISKLRAYNRASNILFFGFGHRSFFRTLTESVSGLKTIALCSCLAEMHSETIAPRILSAFWHEVGYPEHTEPSHQQFLALIKACGGRGGGELSPHPPSLSSQIGCCPLCCQRPPSNPPRTNVPSHGTPQGL